VYNNIRNMISVPQLFFIYTRLNCTLIMVHGWCHVLDHFMLLYAVLFYSLHLYLFAIILGVSELATLGECVQA